jgi:hypothetical protein
VSRENSVDGHIPEFDMSRVLSWIIKVVDV